MTTLDISRHQDLFNPFNFTKQVHVIGVGATGSWIALQLAKLGLTNVNIWDFDRVEAHNIPNQAFGLQHVGQYKVDAMQSSIKYQTDAEFKTNNKALTDEKLSGYVFLLVDSMKERKKLFENCLKLNPNVELVIEPRLGMNMCRVYNVNPIDMNQIKRYEDTYYSDDEAETSACGASLSVITSALITSGWCVRQLINHHNGEEMDNEILIDYKYNNIITNTW